ncbi:MAG: sensor domain-containing diguanylate cyclase [Polyangiaceae bacterium]
MMNSAGARLLLPVAGTPELSNLFDVLEGHAPELRSLTRVFAGERGTICEGHRIQLTPPRPHAPEWLSITLVKIDESRVMAVVADITGSVEQERLLHADRQRFQAIYEGMRDAMICTLDVEGRVATWNSSGERLLGFSEESVLLRLFATLSEDDDAAARLARQMARSLEAGWSELEGWYARRDGSRLWGEGVLAALRDERGAVTGFSVVLRDMTERKLAAERLQEMASRDALTGMHNRRHFVEHAQRELALWRRHRHPLTVALIDADHFKKVNDTHGHATGDEVLRDLATVVREQLRSTDLSARYGGEEFVLLLPSTDAAGAVVLAERIRSAIAARAVVHETGEVSYTVSIGVAEASDCLGSVEALVHAADQALYRAKAEGRNRVILAPAGLTG